MSIPGLPGTAPPLLVGRDRELGFLRAHLAAARAGRGGLVLIGGEAGIGKSALVEAICRDGKRQGTFVLVGQCYDLTETPPYGPWVELFRCYHPTDGDQKLPDHFAQRGTAGKATSQMALFQQVQDFFGAMAASRPLVLVLEDLHWADTTSLDLLRHQARHLTSAALLIIATYRAEEVTDTHPFAILLPALVREARVARLTLWPLDDDAVRLLVGSLHPLPDAAAARLVSYLRTHAEGNPLFIRELLRTLEEQGVLRQEEGQEWTLGDLTHIPVPTLVRQMIAERSARLSDEDRRLLAVAAVIGQEVPLSLWSAVAGVDEGILVAATARMGAAYLIEEMPDGTRVQFLHALIREALYEVLAPSRRRVVHRQVGEALAAARNPDPDAVADHLYRAADASAAGWLIKAGQRAHRIHAYRSAIHRYTLALDLLEGRGGDAECGWLLLHLITLDPHHDPRYHFALLERAERHASTADDRGLAARILFMRGVLRCRAGNFHAGLMDLRVGASAIEAAAQISGAAHEHETLLHMEISPELLIVWLAYSGRLAEAQAEAARALTRLGGSITTYPVTEELATTWYSLAFVLALRGDVTGARRASATAGAIYQALNSGTRAMQLRDELAFMLLPYQTDGVIERERVASEAERETRRWDEMLGVGEASIGGRHMRLPLLEVEGRWREARQILEPHDGRPDYSFLRIVRFGPHGRILRAQGAIDHAWQLVREKLPNGPATEAGDVEITAALPLQLLAVALSLDSGDLPTARAWLEAHDRYVAWSGVVLGVAEGQALWAQYYCAAGDVERAHECAARSLAQASDPRQPLALTAAHRLLGELDTDVGCIASANLHLDAALALADACAAPYERTLTLLALAELRAAEHRRDEAVALLDEVRTICSPLGAKPARARADALMAQLAPHSASGYPEGMTEREIEVLRLIAAGHTNRQIADKLSLSERTVHVHVRNIFAKTHTDNRAGATAFAFRHDLA